MSQSDLWSHSQIEFKGKNTYIFPNPLMWIEADFNGKGATASYANLFQFMSSVRGDDKGLKYAIFRYKKLRRVGITQLPHDYSINKIYTLLKAAVSDFIIEYTIGSIASCGMIGEIMTNYLFMVWNNTVQKKTYE